VIGTDDRKLRFEGRQILLNNFPDNLYIDVEVIVNDAMPQADDFTPLNLGMQGLETLRKAVGGLADDFQIAYDRIEVLSSFTKVS
jgi:hypothetical protein